MKSNLQAAECSLRRRRAVAILATFAAAPASFFAASAAAQNFAARKDRASSSGSNSNASKDGTKIFFKDWGKESVEIKGASHVVMTSHPAEVAKVIEDADAGQ